jgi:hypothetical protein
MPSAKYTETYQKVSKMGEKLKAAGKQGPSNDEQLSVRSYNIPDLRSQMCDQVVAVHLDLANRTLIAVRLRQDR